MNVADMCEFCRMSHMVEEWSWIMLQREEYCVHGRYILRIAIYRFFSSPCTSTTLWSTPYPFFMRIKFLLISWFWISWHLESQKILSQFLYFPSMTMLNLSKKCFLISIIKEKVTENVLHTSGYFENFFLEKIFGMTENRASSW